MRIGFYGRELGFKRRACQGSILIIVLWIAFGLVAITLYFANAMSFELRASDNRVSGLLAEQAMEGGARYMSYVLATLATNGAVPNVTMYYREAVPVGGLANNDASAHFWLIGRDNNVQVQSSQPFFSLIDEGSKLNLNTASNTVLELLPNMTQDFADAIVDWRDPDSTITGNGAEAPNYAMLHPPYFCKNTNFDTIDELRLVYGATMDLLAGEDVNRNGILDLNEVDQNRNGQVDPGLLEYVTVYSREPNTSRTNVNNAQQLAFLLQGTLGVARANEILARFSSAGPGRGRAGGGQSGAVAITTFNTTFRSTLQFYMRSGMTVDEFTQIGYMITATNAAYIPGRVNVNTASAAVLACLPGMTLDLARQLVNYRQINPDKLYSVAWVVEALGQNNYTVLQALAAGDYITTQSYQFTADIAALGPYGRGYRRTRFVFDVSDGTPRIAYRQDLSHLGWALGRDVRQTWVLAKKMQ